MGVDTSIFANVWSQIKLIKSNFNYSNFHQFEVWLETQLQVGENLNYLI